MNFADGHGAALRTPDLERRFVEYIHGTSYADLPEDTIDAARRTLLWSVAIAIAGAGAQGSDAIARFALDHGGREDATIIGIGRRAPAGLAAFANVCFAKAHEYEDKYWLDTDGGFAMGFAVAPAVLAAAEAEGGIDGQRVLAAIALGVDAQARLLSAIKSDLAPTHTGWNSTYLFCNYGATVGVAKVLGLSEAQMLDALGLIHAQAAGNFQGQMEGVLGIRLQGGFAVRNAIAAVELARLGITGAHQFLTGRFGFYKLHFPNHTVDYDDILRDAGRVFLGTNLGFKGYPCGVVAHPILDAVRQLRPKAALKDIRKIKVYGTTILGIMAEPREQRLNPRNAIDAQFSLPWVIACVLRDGNLRLSHFDDALVRNAEYLDIAHKVEIDMQEGRKAATVAFELADGTMLNSEPVEFCKGHPENPVTTEEMVDVLRSHLPLAPVPYTAEEGDRIISRLLAISELSDVRQVFQKS